MSHTPVNDQSRMYTFEEGLNDIARCFARYHGMTAKEAKEYFERVGIMPFLRKYYGGLAYEVDLELIKWLRREIEDLGQPLPTQLYLHTVLDADVVPKVVDESSTC